MRPSLHAAALAAFALLSACGEEAPAGPDIRSIHFVEWLEVDISTYAEHPSGIFYKDVRVGSGAAAATGSRVDFTVQGWLPDGSAVQDYLIRSNIQVGAGSVIEGLDIGLVGMRAGGERKVVVPPHLAHGGAWVMVFRLEMTAVR